MSQIDISLFKANPYGIEIKQEDILETFDFLDDWEERYSYIIDLGKSLPSFPDSEKTDEHLIHGCQSQVWIIHQLDPESQTLYFLIESDAIIVKGLAALVLVLLNAKTKNEIASIDIESIFTQMDLMRHISPTRGNGLRSMIERIKTVASIS